MTPEEETELVTAVKSIAYSLDYIARYVQVIAHKQYGIAPIVVPAKPQPRR
jgi:hypothetical protein